MITLTPRASSSAQESEWSVADHDRLVAVIAEMALGQVDHVMEIAGGNVSDADEPSDDLVNEAITFIRDFPTEHRDGWMFQVISWYVHFQSEPDSLVRAPLPTATRQGFDGIALRLSDDRKLIEYLVVSEEKATINPRDVFVGSVLSEFELLEDGKRERELRPEIVSLLGVSGTEARTVLSSGDWRSRKRYRAAIATSADRMPKKIDLFESFDTGIPGDPVKRQGHRFVHQDMRAYFQDLADNVVDHLQTLRP